MAEMDEATAKIKADLPPLAGKTTHRHVAGAMVR